MEPTVESIQYRAKKPGPKSAFAQVNTYGLDTEPAAKATALKGPPAHEPITHVSPAQFADDTLVVWGGSWDSAVAALCAALNAPDNPALIDACPTAFLLRTLVLVRCGVTTEGVLSLPVLPNLRYLDLSDNPGLRGLGFSQSGSIDFEAYWLAFAPRVVRILLRGCSLFSAPPLLAGSSALAALDISCNEIRDLVEVCGGVALTELDVSSNNLAVSMQNSR